MKPRILIVDDSWSMRQTLRILLTPDFDCALAENASAALEHARRQPPDLIVSDVNMTGMDGYELRRQMRAEPPLAQVPFVFLSGQEPPRPEVTGGDIHLLKPVPPDLLRVRLREMLEPQRPLSRQARG